MWLVRNMHNTVDNMRIAQDEMTLQAVNVQTMMHDLLKAGAKAEETRKTNAACKAEDEAAKIEAAMAAARPVHSVANPVVCQED